MSHKFGHQPRTNCIDSLSVGSDGLLYAVNWLWDGSTQINALDDNGHHPVVRFYTDPWSTNTGEFLAVHETLGTVIGITSDFKIYFQKFIYVPEGWFTTSRINAGTELINKLWAGVDLEVGTYDVKIGQFQEGLESGSIDVYARSEESPNAWALVAQTSLSKGSGKLSFNFTNTLKGTWIKLKFVFKSSIPGQVTTKSPVLRSYAIKYIPQAVFRTDESGKTDRVAQVFSMVIRVQDKIKLPNNTYETRDADEIRADLNTLVNNSDIFTFIDPLGNSHKVIITDFSEKLEFIQSNTKGTQESAFSVELAEV